MDWTLELKDWQERSFTEKWTKAFSPRLIGRHQMSIKIVLGNQKALFNAGGKQKIPKILL